MQGTLPYALTTHGHPGIGDTLIHEATDNSFNKKSIDRRGRVTGQNRDDGGLSNTSMELAGSGVSSNSEWVLFSPYDEEEGAEIGDKDGGEEEGEYDAAETGSILSTRLSSFQYPLNHRRSSSFETAGYVISDFGYSLDSGRVTEEGQSSATDNGEEEADDIYDEDYEDKEDDDDEDGDGDEDSLAGDVRSGIKDMQRSRLDELESKKHEELVSKINTWKHSVKTVNGAPKSQKLDSRALTGNEKKREVKTEKRLLTGKEHRGRESELRVFKSAVNRLCTSLKKERLVEHEGIFMNNPELESCVPGYWKRMMLDNLIQYNAEPGAASLGYNILGDDVKSENRNFWEPEENLSVQSVSTGWEGGSILGF
ncbi:hypothetical protein PMKS-003982 [Pichia membranifaciens]|uniref:Uncharacterized protein n=1 Tax=Pichia membranifaciens TaxID=4926 RepID=A0A1Q2YLP2_9ASCO|nr:hypothetical protein PMKS-003982 [Pichia membranifaciens]